MTLHLFQTNTPQHAAGHIQSYHHTCAVPSSVRAGVVTAVPTRDAHTWLPRMYVPGPPLTAPTSPSTWPGTTTVCCDICTYCVITCRSDSHTCMQPTHVLTEVWLEKICFHKTRLLNDTVAADGRDLVLQVHDGAPCYCAIVTHQTDGHDRAYHIGGSAGLWEASIMHCIV